ncbi:unnamed protein product [Candida parapsilosis]
MGKLLAKFTTQLAQPFDDSTISIDLYDQTTQQFPQNHLLSLSLQQNQSAQSGNPIAAATASAYRQQTQMQLQQPHQVSQSQPEDQHQLQKSLQSKQQQHQQHSQQQQQQQQLSQGLDFHSKSEYVDDGSMFDDEVVPDFDKFTGEQVYITDDSGLGINIVDADILASIIQEMCHGRSCWWP